MNILVTLNSNYVGPLTVMLKSLMKSNPYGKFDLYVAHSSLTDLDFKAIENSTDRKRVTVHPIMIDSALLEKAPVLKRISKETYYRLLLTDYLPKDVNRILYIDPDTVIINDISSLYNIDFKGKLIAAACHVKLLNHIRFCSPPKVRYFNAGVMMLNVQKMRKKVSTDNIFEYINKHRRFLFLADQDVLNGMFMYDVLYIDERIYNLDEKTIRFSKNKITDEWIRKNSVIIHFNGKYKPWKEGYKGVLAHYYFENTGISHHVSTKVG